MASEGGATFIQSTMRRAMKQETNKKVRVTLDLTPPFYERLNQLENLVDGGTKANVIRQALQLYEFIAQRTLEGWSFKAVKDGQEETMVFIGAAPAPSKEQEAKN